MTVYHNDGELIIINNIVPTKEALGIRRQRRIAKMLGGLQTIFDAHEIWTYNPNTARFDAYKNKGGSNILLKAFLASKGIHIRADVASLDTSAITACRFEDDKDLFLFNLKF